MARTFVVGTGGRPTGVTPDAVFEEFDGFSTLTCVPSDMGVPSFLD
jgi:hypothetical protein